MIGQTISHYRILNKIGEGGMGVVYVAEDILLERRVAIKTLNVEPGKQHYRQRFLREARAVSALHHPNIAVVHDYGETPDGKPFIVMELVEGQTLAELLSQGALTLSRVIEIIEDVAKALAEAHRVGIIHRDIKPSNVIINKRGEVKVLDFGLAKNVSDGTEEDTQSKAFLATQTREGVIVGTPMYLSPEQALGLPVDARSDLFSLGAVLYECITGQPSFPGRSAAEICAKVIRDDPPLPSQINSHVPPELDSLTLKLLAKKSEDRYQSSDELLNALKAVRSTLLDSLGTLPAGRILPPSKLHRSARASFVQALRRPRYLVAAFLLTLIAGLSFWGLLRLRATPTYQPLPEAEQWYSRGTNDLRDGTYYQASKNLEQAVRLDPKYVLAHARLAESYAELGYTDKASDEITRANMLFTNNEHTLSESDALCLKAINGVVSRDAVTAIESYQILAQRAQGGEKAYAYVDLGRAYEKNEEIKKALESYEQAIMLNSQYAAAFLRAGILYGRQQDFTKAESVLNEAYRLYEAQTNMEGLTEVLYQRGILFISKGELLQGRAVFEKALEMAVSINNSYQQIRTLLQLSRVSSLIGETDKARQYSIEAVNQAQSNNIYNLAAQGLIDRGNVHLSRSEISLAEGYFKQALNLAQAQNIRNSEARALISLGSLYVQQDDADKGLQYIKQALPFYEKMGYRTEILQAQNLIGQANDLKADYHEALRAFNQQLLLAQQWNNKSQIALATKGIGTVLIHQEQYTEAVSHIEESYSIYNSLGFQLHAGYSLISRAEVFWRMGRYEDAQAALSQARALAEQGDGEFKQLWGRLYVVSAPMALSEQLYSKAIADGRQAISLDDSETKRPAIETQYTVGLAQSLSGLKSQGSQACEEAVERAARAGDPRLLAGAQLALAEALLISGDPARALSTVKSAQEFLERSGQVESEWRAWLIAGRASQRLGDQKAVRESMLRADALLSSLRQRWNDEAFQTYINRPDIKLYRKQLREISAAAQ